MLSSESLSRFLDAYRSFIEKGTKKMERGKINEIVRRDFVVACADCEKTWLVCWGAEKTMEDAQAAAYEDSVKTNRQISDWKPDKHGIWRCPDCFAKYAIKPKPTKEDKQGSQHDPDCECQPCQWAKAADEQGRRLLEMLDAGRDDEDMAREIGVTADSIPGRLQEALIGYRKRTKTQTGTQTLNEAIEPEKLIDKIAERVIQKLGEQRYEPAEPELTEVPLEVVSAVRAAMIEAVIGAGEILTVDQLVQIARDVHAELEEITDGP